MASIIGVEYVPSRLGLRSTLSMVTGGEVALGGRPPEVALVRAMLLQALQDWLLYHEEHKFRHKMNKREVAVIDEWIHSPSEDPWSYRWACDIVGLSPEAVLERVTAEFQRPKREWHY